MKNFFRKSNNAKYMLVLITSIIFTTMVVLSASYYTGVNKSKFQGGLSETADESLIGTPISNSAELKAWLKGVSAIDIMTGTTDSVVEEVISGVGYVKNAVGATELVKTDVLYTNAYLTADINPFNHDSNYILHAGRHLNGNGKTITLVADPRMNTGNLMKETVYNSMVIGTNATTAKEGIRTTPETNIQQGIPNAVRITYGVFLSIIENTASLTNTNFNYTSTSANMAKHAYNIDAWNKTYNFGVVAGRNEGVVDSVNVNLQTLFKQIATIKGQPGNHIINGGIAGVNTNTISYSRVTFSQNAGLEIHNKDKDSSGYAVSSSIGGVTGFNYGGSLLNNQVIFEDATYSTKLGKAIYTETNNSAGWPNAVKAGYAFSGGVVGRSLGGSVDGVIIDVNKPSVNNMEAHLIDAAGGVSVDALFVGQNLDSNISSYKSLFTAYPQTNIFGVGGNGGSTNNFARITGADIKFDAVDQTKIHVSLINPQPDDIIWAVGENPVYNLLSNSILTAKIDIQTHSVVSSGKDIVPTITSIPENRVLEYGAIHEFSWVGSVMAGVPNFDEKNLQIEVVYIDKHYNAIKKAADSRLDVGVYQFNMQEKLGGIKNFAYIDAVNRVLVSLSKLNGYMEREVVTVNPYDTIITYDQADYEYVYDGSNKLNSVKATFANVDGVVVNADLTLNNSDNIINASDVPYNVTAYIKDENYSANTVSVDVKINKAKYDIPKGISLSDVLMQYDGVNHGLDIVLESSSIVGTDAILASFAGADGIAPKAVWTNNSITEVGLAAVVFSMETVSPNYEVITFDALTAKLTITAREVSIEWIGRDYSYTGVDYVNNIIAKYRDCNGVLKMTTVTIDSLDGKFAEYNPNSVDGKYEFTATIENANYLIIENSTMRYGILKKEFDLSLVKWNTSKNNFDYTSLEVSPRLAVEGIIINVTYQITALEGVLIEGNKAVNVGRYNVKAVIDKTSGTINYIGELKITDYEFTISPIYYEVNPLLFPSRQSFTFNNEERVIECMDKYIPVGLDGIPVKITYSHNKIKNVGELNVSIELESESINYLVDASNVTYEMVAVMRPRDVDVEWSQNNSRVYDGLDHKGEITASYTDLSGKIVEIKIKDVGSFVNYDKNGYTFTGIIEDSNYRAINLSGTLDNDGNTTKRYFIDKKALDFSVDDVNIVYTKSTVELAIKDNVLGLASFSFDGMNYSKTLFQDGLTPLTSYNFRGVLRVADDEKYNNFKDSEQLSLNVTTYFTIDDFDTSKLEVGTITYQSKEEIMQLIGVYQNLSDGDMIVKQNELKVVLDSFNMIVRSINEDIQDNSNLAKGSNPVDENIKTLTEQSNSAPLTKEKNAAAAAAMATIVIIALAGMLVKKFRGVI